MFVIIKMYSYIASLNNMFRLYYEPSSG